MEHYEIGAKPFQQKGEPLAHALRRFVQERFPNLPGTKAAMEPQMCLEAVKQLYKKLKVPLPFQGSQDSRLFAIVQRIHRKNRGIDSETFLKLLRMPFLLHRMPSDVQEYVLRAVVARACESQALRLLAAAYRAFYSAQHATKYRGLIPTTSTYDAAKWLLQIELCTTSPLLHSAVETRVRAATAAAARHVANGRKHITFCEFLQFISCRPWYRCLPQGRVELKVRASQQSNPIALLDFIDSQFKSLCDTSVELSSKRKSPTECFQVLQNIWRWWEKPMPLLTANFESRAVHLITAHANQINGDFDTASLNKDEFGKMLLKAPWRNHLLKGCKEQLPRS